GWIDMSRPMPWISPRAASTPSTLDPDAKPITNRLFMGIAGFQASCQRAPSAKYSFRQAIGSRRTSGLASNDVVMGIDFFAQNAQLLLARGSRRRRRTGQVQGKARGLLYLLQLDTWVKAQDVHPLAAGVVSHDGEIGDHAIWAGSRGQTGGTASAGPSEL